MNGDQVAIVPCTGKVNQVQKALTSDEGPSMMHEALRRQVARCIGYKMLDLATMAKPALATSLALPQP